MEYSSLGGANLWYKYLLRSFYSIFNVNFQNNDSNIINLHQSILVLLLRLMTFSPRCRIKVQEVYNESHVLCDTFPTF